MATKRRTKKIPRMRATTKGAKRRKKKPRTTKGAKRRNEDDESDGEETEQEENLKQDEDDEGEEEDDDGGEEEETDEETEDDGEGDEDEGKDEEDVENENEEETEGDDEGDDGDEEEQQPEGDEETEGEEGDEGEVTKDSISKMSNQELIEYFNKLMQKDDSNEVKDGKEQETEGEGDTDEETEGDENEGEETEDEGEGEGEEEPKEKPKKVKKGKGKKGNKVVTAKATDDRMLTAKFANELAVALKGKKKITKATLRNTLTSIFDKMGQKRSQETVRAVKAILRHAKGVDDITTWLMGKTGKLASKELLVLKEELLADIEKSGHFDKETHEINHNRVKHAAASAWDNIRKNGYDTGDRVHVKYIGAATAWVGVSPKPDIGPVEGVITTTRGFPSLRLSGTLPDSRLPYYKIKGQRNNIVVLHPDYVEFV